MKYQRVKADESFVPSLEDKAVEVPRLLPEPKSDHASVDGDAWKQLDIEDFSYGFEYGLRRNCGGLDCNSTRGQDELEFGVLDGLLDEIDEVDDIHAANDISGACADLLLDIELADKISDLDCAPRGRLHLGNSNAESQSPGYSGSSNGIHGFSESSVAIILDSKCKNTSVEKTVKCELTDSSEDKWDYQCQEYVFTTAHDIENLDEVDAANPLESGMSSDDNIKKPEQTSELSALLRQKRLRKPTRRYIEEFSVPKSKQAIGRQKILAADSKDKCLTIRSHNDHLGLELTLTKEESPSETITQETLDEDEKLSDLRSKCISGRQKSFSPASKDKCLKAELCNELHHVKGSKSVPGEECSTGTSTQASFESRPQRGRPKKRPHVSVPESCDERETASESEYDCAKRRKSKKSIDRRKHQRMWTLSEVMKLIDGIAQYGTGRWTDIKRLFFSSSAHRTPVDLRDKWRNLLRACSGQKQKLKQNKKEVEQKLKHAMRPLPKSVIRQICELATLHPYPRFTPGGRYIRRKN